MCFVMAGWIISNLFDSNGATSIAIGGNIRRYTADDIPRIIWLAKRYIPELPNYKGVTVHEDRVKFLLEQNTNNDGAILLNVLVNNTNQVVGCIAAYCVTLLFSWEQVTNDIFLFIEPEWRTTKNAKGLVETYIEWAKARKVSLICASQASGYRGPELERFIKSFGFEEVGKLYHLRQNGDLK